MTAAQDVRECRLTASEVYQAAMPGVVSINALAIDPHSSRDRIRQAIGSGAVLDADQGLIVTNAHVVMGAEHLTVLLPDGMPLRAELVGMDPVYDIAVLAVDPPGNPPLRALTLGDSDRIQVGEDVTAIGHPLGLHMTLSRGVVSAKQRILPVAPFALSEPFIQTDAAINPGNSGGPLLDGCGEVVGMNTAAIAGAQNIGFAVPASLLRKVVPLLVEHGRVIRPWFGFQGQMVNPGAAMLLRIPLVPGLLVELVETGGPADEAGLRGGEVQVAVEGLPMLLGGDIITAINGIRIRDMATLVDVLRNLEVGDTMRLDVFRFGERLTVRYELPERPFLPTDLPRRLVEPAYGGASPHER